jgi:hypothetical protein
MVHKDFNNKIIPYQNSYGLNIFYNKLSKKFGVFFTSIIFFSIIPFCILIITNYIHSSLFIMGNDIGFFEDYPIIELIILINVLIYISYIFFNKYSEYHNKMKKLINFSDDKYSESKFQKYLEDIKNFVTGQDKWLKYRILLHLICLIGTLYFVFVYAHFNITFPWNVWRFSAYPLNFIVFSIYQIIIGGYLIPAIFWRLFTSVYSINDFFKQVSDKEALKIYPLYPDKLGGLKPVGEIALTFHFILLLPLIHIVFSIYLWGITIGSYIGLFVYIPLLIFFFYLPLRNSHKIMKYTWEMQRQNIYENYIVNHEKSLMIDSNNKLKSRKDDYVNFEKMANLSNIYQMLDEMPVWPFDIQILTSFVISIILPVILAVIPFFL